MAGTGGFVPMEQKTDEAGQTYQFTVAQFTALSDEERNAIQKVAIYLLGEKLEADDERLSSTFNILRPCGPLECVPNEEVSDDLFVDIRRKFGCIYDSARELAEEEIGRKGFRERHDFFFCLVVDASYRDTTHVAVVDYDPEKRPICYFLEYRKAKYLHFETLQEIAREVCECATRSLRPFSGLRSNPKLRRKAECNQDLLGTSSFASPIMPVR
jgi:hypothetical protein